ncbi:hypothetical protein JR316_0008054 [Psilocybe cubensis]|uniref:Uncharacterized protein n=2 Tax=Psilocybe cubensis TaxID=181762 RepID=A0A8H7XVL7_PSICU|nr:hypothetical protein JR316_0008054 [Psilocybe cubensis]KAH9479460.1 hypothetical protein JR316_0008054 [Psilocybe cubensis]
MLPGFSATYTPPSSPPSPSPSWPANSSSPPSSPSTDPLYLDEDTQEEHSTRQTRPQVVADPLAASYNAGRVNSKRLSFFEPSTPKKKPRLERKASFPEIALVQLPTIEPTSSREEILWENAIEKAFETGEREIELRGLHLTKIPPRIIKDLSKMVVLSEEDISPVDDLRNSFSSKVTQIVPGRRVFTRIHTAPASTFAASAMNPPSSEKTLSSSSLLGPSKQAMTMYLGQNNIKKLPAEMWTLHNLTVLSLRNNNISHLPPGISQLTNLQSLNVAYNKLQYVPAELLDMKSLTSLILFPNPFIPDPRPNDLKLSVSRTRHTGSRVPPLTEIALRFLLSSPKASLTVASQAPQTVLEQLYPLPLPQGPPWRTISTPLSRILSVCVPGSVAVDDAIAEGRGEDDITSVTGIGRCRNPSHTQSTFVQHSEERYSWLKEIAGIKLGGTAAVLWRGCLQGCLDFLGPANDEPEEHLPKSGEEDEEFMVADEIVIHAVEFGGNELGFDSD